MNCSVSDIVVRVKQALYPLSTLWDMRSLLFLNAELFLELICHPNSGWVWHGKTGFVMFPRGYKTKRPFESMWNLLEQKLQRQVVNYAWEINISDGGHKIMIQLIL